MAGGLQTTFLAALQASLAVLLTLSYGFFASRLNLLSEKSSEDISKLCVKLFLPALLIVNVGSELHFHNITRYIPILIWSVLYNLVSFVLGWGFTKLFKLPAWSTPAIMFNNTTSLPLLLIKSLDTTGILKNLMRSDSESTAAAVSRAQSYFLVCAVVGNSLTFAFGAKLLEETPVNGKKPDGDNEHGRGSENIEDGGAQEDQRNEEDVDEETSLLPGSILRLAGGARAEVLMVKNKYWDRFPKPVQAVLEFGYAFCNPVVFGAIIGGVTGLAPPLHRVFFDEPAAGGFFKAWLTSSLENIGELYAALQLFVVGSKLTHCFVRMKLHQDSGYVPWNAMAIIFSIRFILWPVVSIASIYMLASRTNLLGNDPILWFALMLMPTGPPALKLTSLADVSGAPQHEKLAIAKFLVIAYLISPLICFSVVGSLKASEIVMAQ